jgi:sucrose-6-phosphate hydrolase SacC (GH32 family)
MLAVEIDRHKAELSVNRSRAGLMADSVDYAARCTAPLAAAGTDIRILYDRCSIEIFAADGATVMTALHFLRTDSLQLTLSGDSDSDFFEYQPLRD